MGEQVVTRPWRHRASLAATLIGLALIGVVAFQLWPKPAAPEPEPALLPPAYAYVLGDPAIDLGPLETLGELGTPVRRAKVVNNADDKTLAELELVETPEGPVLLQWRARVDDPFLHLTVPAADLATLAPVLGRHVPDNSTVLAWWDSSRQLGLLADLPLEFPHHLGLPVFVPAQWQARRVEIEQMEQSFWWPGSDTTDVAAQLTAEQEHFRRFVDALVAPEDEGMAMLRELAGDRGAVLVLHLRDTILLGQMAPAKLGVAFRNFGELGDVHGMVRSVRGWMNENEYAAYGVLQTSDGTLRTVALTDEASGNTLAARLLPFTGNNQDHVEGTKLVYKAGGFIVYEIEPEAVAPAPAE